VYSVLKFHKLYVDEWSRRLTRLANIILYVEDLLEEVCGEGLHVSEDILYDPLVFDNSILNIKVKTDNEIDCKPPRELNVNIELAKQIDYDNMHVLYDTATMWFLEYVRSELSEYTIVTDRFGVEYYLAVLEDGHVFLAEGEKYHVRVPFIKTYYTAHTHPTLHPIFSPRDIDVAIDVFTYGGLALAIVTTRNTICIYRRGYFTDTDYYNMRKLRKYLSRKNINIHDIAKILGQGNIRLYVK